MQAGLEGKQQKQCLQLLHTFCDHYFQLFLTVCRLRIAQTTKWLLSSQLASYSGLIMKKVNGNSNVFGQFSHSNTAKYFNWKIPSKFLHPKPSWKVWLSIVLLAVFKSSQPTLSPSPEQSNVTP